MFSRLIAFCLGFVVCGCVRESARQADTSAGKVPTVWQASTDNGDKPGIGITIQDYDGRITATFVLLDPNKPHDFKAGKALATEIVQTNEFHFRLVVHLDETRRDEFVLQFEGPLKGERLNATIRDFGTESQPIKLIFERQK
jgi:hypothetical protein